MSVLPLVLRPDAWDLPLFVHVAGAMVLVGTALLAGVALAGGLRAAGSGQGATLTRFGFRTLLLGALPAFIVMRVGAEWIVSKEDIEDPAWVGVGFITSDGGALLLIAGLITAGIAQKRMGRGDGASGLTRAATILTLVLLAAMLVAVWAMSTKPT
ncbi:MAG: hypothetical protein QOD86_2880 [Miltoncostaeaceae bacterium]|jgi:hypothetical protein|nr:hypothetical protein [Miltoncostaeaceae bacterium]